MREGNTKYRVFQVYTYGEHRFVIWSHAYIDYDDNEDPDADFENTSKSQVIGQSMLFSTFLGLEIGKDPECWLRIPYDSDGSCSLIHMPMDMRHPRLENGGATVLAIGGPVFDASLIHGEAEGSED